MKYKNKVEPSLPQKGTVCDDMFNVNAATLICKSMGYKCASNWDVKKELEIQQNFKIILDNVMCTRPSGEFSEACSFSTSHNCGHDEDIFLNCGKHPTYILNRT